MALKLNAKGKSGVVTAIDHDQKVATIAPHVKSSVKFMGVDLAFSPDETALHTKLVVPHNEFAEHMSQGKSTKLSKEKVAKKLDPKLKAMLETTVENTVEDLVENLWPNPTSEEIPAKPFSTKLGWAPHVDSPILKKSDLPKLEAVLGDNGSIWVGMPPSPDGLVIAPGEVVDCGHGLSLSNDGGVLTAIEICEPPLDLGPEGHALKVHPIPVKPPPAGFLQLTGTGVTKPYTIDIETVPPTVMEEPVSHEYSNPDPDDILAGIMEPIEHKAPPATGKVQVATTKEGPNGMATVNEEQVTNMQVKPIPAGLLYNVNIHQSMTLALENYGGNKYENVKIGVSLTVPCTKETLDDAYGFADQWTSAKMEEAIKKAKGG
jgi:hypothetical protein